MLRGLGGEVNKRQARKEERRRGGSEKVRAGGNHHRVQHPAEGGRKGNLVHAGEDV